MIALCIQARIDVVIRVLLADIYFGRLTQTTNRRLLAAGFGTVHLEIDSCYTSEALVPLQIDYSTRGGSSSRLCISYFCLFCPLFSIHDQSARADVYMVRCLCTFDVAVCSGWMPPHKEDWGAHRIGCHTEGKSISARFRYKQLYHPMVVWGTIFYNICLGGPIRMSILPGSIHTHTHQTASAPHKEPDLALSGTHWALPLEDLDIVLLCVALD